MAPEQIRGEPATRETDIYALGTVLYECLSGAVPFPKDSDVAVMYAHLADPPPTITTSARSSRRSWTRSSRPPWPRPLPSATRLRCGWWRPSRGHSEQTGRRLCRSPRRSRLPRNSGCANGQPETAASGPARRRHGWRDAGAADRGQRGPHTRAAHRSESPSHRRPRQRTPAPETEVGATPVVPAAATAASAAIPAAGAATVAGASAASVATPAPPAAANLPRPPPPRPSGSRSPGSGRPRRARRRAGRRRVTSWGTPAARRHPRRAATSPFRRRRWASHPGGTRSRRRRSRICRSGRLSAPLRRPPRVGSSWGSPASRTRGCSRRRLSATRPRRRRPAYNSRPNVVKIGPLQASRTSGVSFATSGKPLYTFIYFPQGKSSTTMAVCYSKTGSVSELVDCEKAASAIRISGAKLYDLVPSKAYATSLGAALSKLTRVSRVGYKALKSAKTTAAQATAARTIAAAYSSAAGTVRKLKATPYAQPANQKIATALAGVTQRLQGTRLRGGQEELLRLLRRFEESRLRRADADKRRLRAEKPRVRGFLTRIEAHVRDREQPA